MEIWIADGKSGGSQKAKSQKNEALVPWLVFAMRARALCSEVAPGV
jgi:hypothetical protein